MLGAGYWAFSYQVFVPATAHSYASPLLENSTSCGPILVMIISEEVGPLVLQVEIPGSLPYTQSAIGVIPMGVSMFKLDLRMPSAVGRGVFVSTLLNIE